MLTSKAGRKLGKKLLTVGGIAAVGGLAYAAYRRYREDQEPALAAGRAEPVPSMDRLVPAEGRTQEAEVLSLVLLRAMVAAAHADGQLDGPERHAIYERVGSLDLSKVEKANLLAGLSQPASMSELVAAASSPEIAAEIYTASLLAIEVDTPAERAYLAMFAARLGLPEALVRSIHKELGVPQEPGALPSLGVAS